MPSRHKVRRVLHRPSRLAVAYHEAGHAIAAQRLLRGVKCVRVGDNSALISHGCAYTRGAYLCRAKVLPFDDPKRSERAFRSCVMSYAGPVAHSRFARLPLDRVLEVWGISDVRQAHEVAGDVREGLIVFGGMVICGPGATVTGAARAFCEAALEAAKELVARDWRLISAAARNFAKRGELLGDDPVLRKISRHGTPQRSAAA